LENPPFHSSINIRFQLKMLCILSYIWISIVLLAQIGCFVFLFLLFNNQGDFFGELITVLNGGHSDLDRDLKVIAWMYLLNFIMQIVTFIGVILMHKKNEIGLIIYAIGELSIYFLLFFNNGISRLTLSLQGGGGSYSGMVLVYGVLFLLLISDILFIFLYYRALEKAKGKLFLNFLN
jgi:hypothetical protein